MPTKKRGGAVSLETVSSERSERETYFTVGKRHYHKLKRVRQSATERDTMRRKYCIMRGMDNLYSIGTAAARLDCHPETLRRMIRRGDLAAMKIGKHWRVSERVLQEYLDRRAKPARDAAE
jgi:excisionase family DNA binding protein